MSKAKKRVQNNAIDTQVDNMTNKDAVIKAREIAAPIEEKSKKRKKLLLENAATVISMLAISLTVILYAYNKGVSRVFGIPVSCIPLDLKSFAPLALIVGGLLTYLFYYTSLFKTDVALGSKKVNPLRVFWGFLIIRYLLDESKIGNYLGTVWSYALPAIISIATEVIVYLIRRPRKIKRISKETYGITVENHLYEGFLYSSFFKTGLIFIVIAITFSPLIGEISAKANTEYQTCVYNEEQYAIIVNYDDRVLAQRAKIVNNNLTIYTCDYIFFEKENTIFVFNKYDSVEIISDYPDESEIATEQTDSLIESSAEPTDALPCSYAPETSEMLPTDTPNAPQNP